jgi:hypothetical protein
LSFKNDHIEEEDLERYSKQVLDEESAALVETHLLVCQNCQQRLVEVEAYTVAMKYAALSLLAEERSAARKRWTFFPRLIPTFAAVALLAVAVVTLPLVRTSNQAPVPVSLQTMRGTANLAIAPALRPLRLDLDLTGLAPAPVYNIELVAQTGEDVWNTTLKSEGAEVPVTIPAQRGGVYFVRVALPSGQTIREYALQIRDTD